MTGRLDPPQWYDAERRTIWDDTIRRLTDAGGLFKADPRILDAYVCAYANHTQAARLVAASGVLITTATRGPVENPALTVQRRTAADLAAASRALGLHRTPITDVIAAAPMAARPGRWCDQHRRYECVHDRNKGGPCHAQPVRGLETCKNHGGKPLAVLKEQGRAALARLYATPAEVTPAEALLEEVRWSAGHVGQLRARVAELAAEPGPDGEPGSGLWWGVVKETVRDGDVVERELRAGPHVILKGYADERAHLVRAAAAAEAAGALPEAVSAAKALGAGVHALLEAIFRGVQLQDWQWQLVPQVVPALLAGYDPDPAAAGPETGGGG